MEIRDSVALVTGGASGLGEATVRRLASAGAKVVIVDLNEERGQAVAEELGDGVRFVRADASSAEDVSAAVAAAQEMGVLRIAVSCAGIGPPAKVVGRDAVPHDLDLFEKIIKVNLVGTFNVLRLSAAAMSANEPNADGERGVVGMTLPAARDLMKTGIRVMTIAPGTFDTPLLAGLPQKVTEALAAGIPFPKRLGRPDEYAELVEAIVRNAYLNAEVIRIDGALRMPPR